MQRKSLLQEEIRQSKPFKSSAHEAFVDLLKTTDVVRRKVAVVVERYGLTMQQYNVLRILRGAGTEGLPTLAIAERMIERHPGITRLLDRLEKKGFVCRERMKADRRQVRCWITPKGTELLEKVTTEVEAVVEQIMNVLDDQEKLLLIGLLDRLRRGEVVKESEVWDAS